MKTTTVSTWESMKVNRTVLATSVLLGCGALIFMPAKSRADTALADQPIISGSGTVPGNLLLALSVEYPTAVDNAFTSDYSSTTSNVGYFDPTKCYTYVTTGTGAPFFQPYSYQAGTNATNHTCTSTVKVTYTAKYSSSKKPTSFPQQPQVDTANSTLLWSGSFLNWATMQTIDPFRWALTGGYRDPTYDTSTMTILEKAWASGQGGTGDFPDRTVTGLNSNSPTTLTAPTSYSSNKSQTDTVTTTFTITGVTPFPLSSMAMRIEGLGNKMNFAYGGSGGGAVSSSSPTTYDPSIYVGDKMLPSSGTTLSTNTGVWSVQIRVKVCDSIVGPESNCTQYGSNYKPEGLIQKHALDMRFSAFGYLNDSNIKRDGGVMRARMKYVGPLQPNPGSSSTTNTAAEWSSSTGVFVTDPDSSDSSASGVTNSGVINYLNKFGRSAGTYKSYDPVSELYYAGIRYYKHLNNSNATGNGYYDGTGANVPEYTNSLTSTMKDGFPVITTWDDPIQYSCQKNFILGIGDVNTHADSDLPGASSPPFSSTTEPTTPTAVSKDDSVNVTTATNKVGSLENLGNLGTISPSTKWCCNNNSYYIAGLAYDSHTKDMRPNDFKNSDGTKSYTQTVSTYWLDVQEYQKYIYQNQFWLAAKYGGFTVPSGFDPYSASTTSIPTGSWESGTDVGFPNGDGTYITSATAHSLPSHYFNAGNPTSMVSGLNSAFSSIASEITSAASSLNIGTLQSTSSGNMTYDASYNVSDWTGDVIGYLTQFNSSTGAISSQTKEWDASAELTTKVAGGYTSRIIATSAGVNTTSPGLAIDDSQVTTLYSSQLSTVGSASVTPSDLVNYLRGDSSKEGTTFRSRSGNYLGDIVDSKLTVVGPPSAPYLDANNSGYSSFKSLYSSRTTMLYFGANDGMMHALDGSSTGGTAGEELFAYIPSFLFAGPNGTPAVDGLAGLANSTFTHHYYVNATPGVFDIDFAKTGGTTGTADWHSVLIGGLGKGGKGYYALDVTSPGSITSNSILAGKVLWEFQDSDGTEGYSFGDPIVVKTKKYGWVAIFTSGYNNSDGKGYLYIVNPKTGERLDRIPTATGSTTNPAGLAFASAYVADFADYTADSVYAGDLLGNIWRFNLTDASATKYSDLAPSSVVTKIATLADSGGTAQPVTTRPLIEVDPETLDRYVLVGTGKLLSVSDISDSQTQSFYAIKDGTRGAFNSSGTFPITRSDLLHVTDLTTGVNMSSSSKGWYYDMSTHTSSGSSSERVSVTPAANNGIVAWAGNIPSGDVCSGSGTSYVYAVAYGTGKSVLTNTIFSVTSGMVTNLVFVNVNGTPRLYAATTSQDTDTKKNDTDQVPGSFSTSVGYTPVNWREIPTSN
jgi:type IV pilus assembly protein PilY1